MGSPRSVRGFILTPEHCLDDDDDSVSLETISILLSRCFFKVPSWTTLEVLELGTPLREAGLVFYY